MIEQPEKLIADMNEAAAALCSLPDGQRLAKAVIHGRQLLDRLNLALEATTNLAKTASASWRCFHCDEVFTDEDAARLHFGESEIQEPLCLVTGERYREVERQLVEYRNESDAQSKTFYSLGAEHYVKERQAEDKGYARGLADAREHTEARARSMSPALLHIRAMTVGTEFSVADLPGEPRKDAYNAATYAVRSGDAIHVKRGQYRRTIGKPQETK